MYLAIYINSNSQMAPLLKRKKTNVRPEIVDIPMEFGILNK